MKDEENLAMIVKFVKYLIDKDVLDKQYEEDSIYGLTIMLEKIAAYVVLFCIAFIFLFFVFHGYRNPVIARDGCINGLVGSPFVLQFLFCD